MGMKRRPPKKPDLAVARHCVADLTRLFDTWAYSAPELDFQRQLEAQAIMNDLASALGLFFSRMR
jgi:hypothetical protein